MKKGKGFSAMLLVDALGIVVFGAGLLLLAFYMSYEIGIIVSAVAAVVVVAVAVALAVAKAVRKRREKAPEYDETAEDTEW
ncbi:MAG: hypothetical protein LUD51_00115 [Clostridia bacterium]|nr:hypothetical protein [Clostridia bacterium]